MGENRIVCDRNHGLCFNSNRIKHSLPVLIYSAIHFECPKTALGNLLWVSEWVSKRRHSVWFYVWNRVFNNPANVRTPKFFASQACAALLNISGCSNKHSFDWVENSCSEGHLVHSVLRHMWTSPSEGKFQNQALYSSITMTFMTRT